MEESYEKTWFFISGKMDVNKKQKLFSGSWQQFWRVEVKMQPFQQHDYTHSVFAGLRWCRSCTTSGDAGVSLLFEIWFDTARVFVIVLPLAPGRLNKKLSRSSHCED
jgi:hypothetical protein